MSNKLKQYHSKVVVHKSSNYEGEIDYGESHVVHPSPPSFITIEPENKKRKNDYYYYFKVSCATLADKFYYGLRIVTGDQANATADTSDVVLSLTGDKGTTGEITVDAKEGWFLFETHFKQSTYDDLIIESDGDLGEIQVVQAGLRYKRLLNIITPNWYIDYFTVCNYQTTVLKNYPCYHWIGKAIKDVTATSTTSMYLFTKMYCTTELFLYYSNSTASC